MGPEYAHAIKYKKHFEPDHYNFKEDGAIACPSST